MRAPALATLAALFGTACTDAGLYAVGSQGPSGPDRIEIVGSTCVPLAAGDRFPVKVLYVFPGGANVPRPLVGQLADGLSQLAAQFSQPYISFGLIAYHTASQGLQGKFVPASDLTAAITRYSAYQQDGPVTMRAPLLLAKSLLSGDMQSGCRGLVARTRYLVVLVVNSSDTSCAYPVFNPGVDQSCNMYPAGDVRCSTCELARVTQELRDLVARYGAGEVQVQPVYINDGNDPASQFTRFQADSIARAGGTQLIETDSNNLANALKGINYASLQRELVLKRLIAFNRNVVVRDGVQRADSDADGISDEDERSVGTDPTLADSDSDGLMDGIELKMGLRPQGSLDGGMTDPANLDVINGCEASKDTDGDYLNDCEERVLGTDPCISDTDGDGLPDMVEWHSGTNPLLPEDLNDADRDGYPNIDEVTAHTDPGSADIAFRKERGYGYRIEEQEKRTIDGRICYDIAASNIGLVPTLERPNPFGFGRIQKGVNDIYLFLQVGRENDPRGNGIGTVFVQPVRFVPPGSKFVPTNAPRPTTAPVVVSESDFQLGN